ncbi:MAG: 4Fe-4S dicluster domain-containing protein [Chloroflexi bacterium]|nr:4Fe-4S dicluster domain-containing protein [Chloroflexota bacterium]
MKRLPADYERARFGVPIKIDIDYAKCPEAQDCQKCVRVCPLGVIALSPLEDRRIVKREPMKWRAVPVATAICNFCGSCTRACPKDAVSLIDLGR